MGRYRARVRMGKVASNHWRRAAGAHQPRRRACDRGQIIGLRSTSSRYGAGARAFHWLTVMLVLAAYALSKGDRYSLYSAAADGLRRIHEALGMLVFIVEIGRASCRERVCQYV